MLLVKTNWVNERAATAPSAIMDYVKTLLLKPCNITHNMSRYVLTAASHDADCHNGLCGNSAAEAL
jgi:hypothetical protein